jgi:acyl-CoA thioesterase-1
MSVVASKSSWRRLAFSSFTLTILLASLVQAQTAVRIVALGASNTEGWGVLPAQSYPAQLQILLRARGIEASVFNAGIAGDTTGGMLARLDQAVPAGTHLVILQPGTNDARMGLGAERSANIEKIRTALSARNTKLLVIENSVLDALPRSELRDDGLHFTPSGYALLAERVLPMAMSALGL